MREFPPTGSQAALLYCYPTLLVSCVSALATRQLRIGRWAVCQRGSTFAATGCRMAEESFKVGDRVRVRTTSAIQRGSYGTIGQASSQFSSTYGVLIDGLPEVRYIMHVSDLERATDEKKPSDHVLPQ